MCGIVGILGKHEVSPTLVEALRRLEYRGYDSAGIATVNGTSLDRRRAVGKLVNLSDLLVHEPLAGKSGLGHTRWATHGAPTLTNTHPHATARVAVVHNGIIENYRELRAELSQAGIAHQTETDTETVALMAQHHIDAGATPEEAARLTVGRLEGAYALAFLFDGEPDLMIAARKGSPLAIGHGEGEVFIGSDAIALAPMTDRITYLEEGDCAILTRERIRIIDGDGKPVEREMRTIRIDAARIDKAGHKHFMSKEIAEQPTVISDTLSAYVAADAGDIALPGEGIDFASVERITMASCGTAYYACLTAKYWFEQLAGLPVEVDYASEFRYREPPVTDGTAALFVSQSGETADTLAALRYCAGRARTILAITNVPESSIARESDLNLPIHAGAEIGVASTKAFTCQLTVLLLLALKAGHARGRLDADTLKAKLAALRGLPAVLNQATAIEDEVRTISQKLSKSRDALFLGRGRMFPIALEGALKLKEISYIHAEGIAKLFAASAAGTGFSMQIPSSMSRLKGFRFPREIIAYAVWAYHRFALSTADVEDLLAERGVIVSREAIRLWVNRFGAHFAACIRRDRPRPNDKWHLDEVVVPINGVKHWLWRAVDGNGDTLEILVQTRRNAKAAKRFLTRLIAQFGQPRVVITDKLRSYTKPIERAAPGADHRAHKGLNNRIEGSHRPTRRREKIMGRFKSHRQAQRFLAAHDQISTIFKPRRYRLTATSYRHARSDAFELWTDYALKMKP